MASSGEEVYLAAIILGSAAGINSPVTFAWTIDLANNLHRGRAMATVYIAMEAGIGLGAFSSGVIYQNNPLMFRPVFWTAGILALLALAFLIKIKLYSCKSKNA